MSSEIPRQLSFPELSLPPALAVVSASRRTELVGLKPEWLVHALQRFPVHFKKEVHSVVLWTKDPKNVYENEALKTELAKYNLLIHCTVTGLGGTRIEPTVPDPDKLINELPGLLDFLGNPQRLRWRFDPIVTLEKADGNLWSSDSYFADLAQKMASLGIDNCYFSFCQIYQRKFTNRKLNQAGINFITPSLQEQKEIIEKMKEIAKPLKITLYSCTQPQLTGIPGIIPASYIDAALLTDLHPQKLPALSRLDSTMTRLRPGCFCTESIDIGAYISCGHGCVYCYAEAALPDLNTLLQKLLPWETRNL